MLKASVRRKFFNVMKLRIPILAAAWVAFSTLQTHAQTLNWGVQIGELLIDSNGDAIDDSYVFELGAFALNYDPQEANVGEWLTHWRVFDALTYDSGFGFSTSAPKILNGVTSDSQKPNVSNESFAGLDAYIWIRKGINPEPGSEWFVGRAIDWTFPLEGGDCCDTNTIQWAISDLGPGEVPEWGRQYDVPGAGTRSQNEDIEGLQTHTFPIPEPSSALLTSIAGFGLLLRRRRNA
jgi:hypothetical protein